MRSQLTNARNIPDLILLGNVPAILYLSIFDPVLRIQIDDWFFQKKYAEMWI